MRDSRKEAPAATAAAPGHQPSNSLLSVIISVCYQSKQHQQHRHRQHRQHQQRQQQHQQAATGVVVMCHNLFDNRLHIKATPPMTELIGVPDGCHRSYVAATTV